MAQTNQSGAVSGLLWAWGRGDFQARDDLVPLIYRELRRRAGAYLRRERRDHTLQPTALVHEAFIRLIGPEQVAWQGRAHFFGIAANLMRRILVDHAREHQAAKRQGAAVESLSTTTSARWPLPTARCCRWTWPSTSSRRVDARQAQIVELRYFGGLSEQEVAAALSLSRATVTREWQSARTWLYRRMTVGSADARAAPPNPVVTGGRRPVQNQTDRCGAGVVHERVHQKPLPIGGHDVLRSEDRDSGRCQRGRGKVERGRQPARTRPARGSDGTAISVPSSAM